MIDLMLDIETIGKKPGVVVLDVAIVPFHINGKELTSEEKKEFTFRCQLNAGEQIALGYHVDKDTLDWWSKQDPKVRLTTWSGVTMLAEFRKLLLDYIVQVEQTFKEYRIWDTAFDKLAVEALFEQEVFPFFYRAKRCCRTLTDLAKLLFPKEFKLAPAGKDLHDAEADCVRQIKDAVLAYKLLRRASNNDAEVQELSKVAVKNVDELLKSEVSEPIGSLVNRVSDGRMAPGYQ